MLFLMLKLKVIQNAFFINYFCITISIKQ